MRTSSFFYILACLLLVTACGKDDPAPPVDPDEHDTNAWIYQVMYDNYLWYKDLPAKSSLDFSIDPEAFFNGLRSGKDGVMYGSSHLYFSAIEKKPATTKAIADNEPTYGFEFVLFSASKNGTRYAQILYVLPGSPADKAGLKRGDWIIAFGANEKAVTMENYSALETGGATSFKLAKLENNVLSPNGTASIEAAVTMDNNPFIKDTVLVSGGKSIGYLAYTHFSSGPNNNADKSYDNQMKDIFSRFKAKQVNEFVLDLRYNGGGLVSSARLLSSLLAPASALGKVCCYMEYNDKKPASSNITMSFDNSVAASNLNLSRLYVLTGDWTASASEAVINMLIPYLGRDKITLIGTKTIGKPVGSNTYGENENYDYLLHPIVLRIYNKDHQADYTDGFTPDILLDEYQSNNSLSPLGTPDEELLAEALRQITGSSLKSARVTRLSPFGEPVYSSLDRRGVNGLILGSNLNP